MAVSRVVKYLLGTTMSSGVTIANNASATSASELDFFGNDTSEGHGRLYLVYTATATAGALNVELFRAPVSGSEATAQAIPIAQIPVSSGTSAPIDLGPIDLARYGKGYVLNNGVGSSVTNVVLVCDTYVES